jgi:hypothetical protein
MKEAGKDMIEVLIAESKVEERMEEAFFKVFSELPEDKGR